MSDVEELLGQNNLIAETIKESLEKTRAVVEQIGESMEELRGALDLVQQSTTGASGLKYGIIAAKEKVAQILGEDSVAGFAAAEEQADQLHGQLDRIRQAIEDLETQFDAAKDETDIVSDEDLGAVATTEEIANSLKAQAAG